MRFVLSTLDDGSRLHVTATPRDPEAAKVRSIWRGGGRRLCGRLTHNGSGVLCEDCALRLSSLLLVSRLILAGRIEIGEEVRDGEEEDTAAPVRDRWSA